MTNPSGIGQSVRRVEDIRFITGNGNYTDDINRPGQTYAFFVRSPHAHAMIKSIDLAAALKAIGPRVLLFSCGGVLLVFLAVMLVVILVGMNKRQD